MIDITGLDKVSVFMALYYASHTPGFEQLPTVPLRKEVASNLLEVKPRQEYLYGHVIKIDFSGNTIDPRQYDRENGAGATQRVIDELKAKN